MAAHAKSGGRLAAFVQWAAAAIAAVLVFGIGCVAGYQSKDSFGQSEYWIIFGGNTDPGDGQGNGAARDQMVAGGWTTYENSYQVQWKADISQGTERQTPEAVANGQRAINDLCSGHVCVVAGFSLGTIPAEDLAAQAGIAPGNTYLFGGPAPSTGVWHQPYINNPFIEPWFSLFGNFDTNQVVRPGTNALYDTHDPYANSAPQCGGPGLFLLSVNPGHRIISRDEAQEHVWTGSDGVVMHEAGYQPAPFGLPRSGSDPHQPWDFCPPNMPEFGIPAMNGDPGVPQLPGIPQR
jgi:hypothetical protein